MLVAQDPGGNFHFLKHFYWNVIWEHHFQRSGPSSVVIGNVVRLQQNVQRSVHSGNPRDSKFLGKELNLSLPVSNTVSRQAPRIFEAVRGNYTLTLAGNLALGEKLKIQVPGKRKLDISTLPLD